MSALAYKQTHLNAAQSLNTLVLRDALAALSLYQKKIHILDLGTLYPASLDFFNQYHCKLTVADAVDTLCAFTHKKISIAQQEKQSQNNVKNNSTNINKSNKTGSVQQSTYQFIHTLFTNLVPDSQTFDLVLGWDSLNYMRSEDRREFINYLSQYTHSHSLLHTFITTSQYICPSPAKFIIKKSDHVDYFEHGEKVDHHPFTRYQMKKEFPGLSITKAILMRNGLQEIAFRFKQ